MPRYKIKDTNRVKVIKRYLVIALSIPPHLVYRRLGKRYSALDLASYLKSRGYVPESDGRTTKAKVQPVDQLPIMEKLARHHAKIAAQRVPKGETLC